MTPKRRMKIVARCHQLRLWHNGDTYRMTGGKWGDHSLRERCFNARVAAHWTGYCTNNGLRPNAADHWPQATH